MSWANAWAFWTEIKTFIPEGATIIGVLTVVATIVAARMAAKPVWRQLTGEKVQTDVQLRDFVLEQLRRLPVRREWYLGRLRKFNDDTGRRIYEMENFEKGGVNVHWAFDQEKHASSLLAEILKHGETRDLSAVENELAGVKASLSKLIDTLDSIHRPASMDQHDEDHSFTDQEWSALEAAGDKAEKDLSGVANELVEATMRLDEAFASELRTYQRQLTQLQASIKAKL